MFLPWNLFIVPWSIKNALLVIKQPVEARRTALVRETELQKVAVTHNLT